MVQRINPRFILRCVLFFISEKLLLPISKNENKPLQTLPSLAKPAAALQTFNSAILTPVSNNNTGFLRNLLNSSGGKVHEKILFYMSELMPGLDYCSKPVNNYHGR